MKLSVIIVNYNVKYYVDQCLRSVLRAFEVMQSAELSGDAEVIVVDNHSADGSVEYLQGRYPAAQYPKVRIVSSMHNLGFARANNIGVRQSQGEYVLLLNPDTIVGEHVLEECVAFMDAHPDAGALGVRMLGASGVAALESRRGVPSPWVAFCKMMGLCHRFPESRRFGHYYMGYLPWDEPVEIEVVSGAFCMLRRKAIQQVGLLDEDFFMYGEDIDLSCRILKGGFRNYYLPVDILHYKGESTEKSSFRYVHIFYQAMLIFLRKHYAGMSVLFSLPLKMAIYAKAVMALLRMQYLRLRKSLGFYGRSKASPPVLVLQGSEEMKRACREIALRRGVEVQEPWDGKHSCCMVFDADTFSYEQMLQAMRKQDHQLVKLGTYSAEMGVILTEQEILS